MANPLLSTNIFLSDNNNKNKFKKNVKKTFPFNNKKQQSNSSSSSNKKFSKISNDINDKIGPLIENPNSLGFNNSIKHKRRSLPQFLISQKPQLKQKKFKQDPWDKANQSKMQQLDNSIDDITDLYETLKKMRDVERKIMEKKNLVDKPDLAKNLNDAIIFQGTCLDMCPIFERARRNVEHTVYSYEKISNNNNKAAANKSLKVFARPAAAAAPPLPSDVRPPHILIKSLNYIIDNLLSTLPNSESFIWDRMRSIRQDFTYQNYSGPEAIECNEKIVRIHLLIIHIMVKSGIEFSLQQELEQLHKSLITLSEIYDEVRSNSIDNKNFISPNEPEFRAYALLSKIRDPEYDKKIQELPKSIFNNNNVQFALIFRKLISNSNYSERGFIKTENGLNFFNNFFNLLNSDKIPLLIAFFCEIYINEIRFYAIKSLSNSLNKKLKPILFDYFKKNLSFNNNDEIKTFCNYYSIDIVDDNSIDVKTLTHHSHKLPEQKPLKQSYLSSIDQRLINLNDNFSILINSGKPNFDPKSLIQQEDTNLTNVIDIDNTEEDEEVEIVDVINIETEPFNDNNDKTLSIKFDNNNNNNSFGFNNQTKNSDIKNPLVSNINSAFPSTSPTPFSFDTNISNDSNNKTNSFKNAFNFNLKTSDSNIKTNSFVKNSAFTPELPKVDKPLEPNNLKKPSPFNFVTSSQNSSSSIETKVQNNINIKNDNQKDDKVPTIDLTKSPSFNISKENSISNNLKNDSTDKPSISFNFVPNSKSATPENDTTKFNIPTPSLKKINKDIKINNNNAFIPSIQNEKPEFEKENTKKSNILPILNKPSIFEDTALKTPQMKPFITPTIPSNNEPLIIDNNKKEQPSILKNTTTPIQQNEKRNVQIKNIATGLFNAFIHDKLFDIYQTSKCEVLHSKYLQKIYFKKWFKKYSTIINEKKIQKAKHLEFQNAMRQLISNSNIGTPVSTNYLKMKNIKKNNNNFHPLQSTEKKLELTPINDEVNKFMKSSNMQKKSTMWETFDIEKLYCKPIANKCPTFDKINNDIILYHGEDDSISSRWLLKKFGLKISKDVQEWNIENVTFKISSIDNQYEPTNFDNVQLVVFNAGVTSNNIFDLELKLTSDGEDLTRLLTGISLNTNIRFSLLITFWDSAENSLSHDSISKLLQIKKISENFSSLINDIIIVRINDKNPHKTLLKGLIKISDNFKFALTERGKYNLSLKNKRSLAGIGQNQNTHLNMATTTKIDEKMKKIQDIEKAKLYKTISNRNTYQYLLSHLEASPKKSKRKLPVLLSESMSNKQSKYRTPSTKQNVSLINSSGNLSHLAKKSRASGLFNNNTLFLKTLPLNTLSPNGSINTQGTSDSNFNEISYVQPHFITPSQNSVQQLFQTPTNNKNDSSWIGHTMTSNDSKTLNVPPNILELRHIIDSVKKKTTTK